jgi:hypothetical protein
MNNQHDAPASDFGSSGAASLGGKARAKSLSPEERSAIARTAALAKHGKELPKASHEGFLYIGEMEIPCAVLHGGKRVLTLSGFMLALGRARQAKGRQYYKGDVNLPTFLTASNLKPFIPPDLEVTSKGLEFRTLTGGRAYGYDAELLPKVCWVFLDAKAAGGLKKNQEHIADKAMVLVRALTSTSIIALVDEATGYQYERPRRELEEQLAKFLSENLRKWVRTFPSDYFKHLCRLRGVDLRPDMKLPQYFGHLTNNLIYRRIAPGLLRKLKERRVERGKLSDKLQQWLSEDIGVREVLVHLGLVIGQMKSHDNYEGFEKALDKIAPVYAESPGLFDDPDDWNE